MQGIEVWDKREGGLGPGVLTNVIKMVCWRRFFVVPSILLFLLFVNNVFLVGRRISNGFRGVLPPEILAPWMFAVVPEVCLVLPVVGLTPARLVDEHDISLVSSPL